MTGDGQGDERAVHSRLGGLGISSGRETQAHTICLFGELDRTTAPYARHELESVDASDASVIVLDLRGLTFIDTIGLRLLLAAHVRSRANADRLTVMGGPSAIQRALDLIDELLQFAGGQERQPSS
jgi:stage II sporulation protein AA (anti-sigma F factor antagonist)